MNSADVVKVEFTIYSDAELRKLSVAQITCPEPFNYVGDPNKGGVYDLRLGGLGKKLGERCGTCEKTETCIGHMGHVELALPVYNPILVEGLVKLLNSLCFGCGRMQVDANTSLLFKLQMKLLARGYPSEALRAEHLLKEEPVVKIAEGSIEETVSPLEYLEVMLAKYDQHFDKIVSQCEDNGDLTADTSLISCVKAECRKIFERSMKLKSCCKFCFFPMLRASYKADKGQMFLNLHTKRDKLPKETKQKLADIKESEEEYGLLGMDPTNQIILMQDHCRRFLREVWRTESSPVSNMCPFLRKKDHQYPTDLFFMSVLPVNANRYRPLAMIRDTHVQHDSCLLLMNVLVLSHVMGFLAAKIKDPEGFEISADMQTLMTKLLMGLDTRSSLNASNTHRLDELWRLMQGSVDNLFNAEANKDVKQTVKGIKQLLEKKEGLYRSNLMGKRVNFSARSVIAPDPGIAVDEVGVPLDFAKHLEYPEGVTSYNVALMRSLVMNGPETYPGAHAVGYENNTIVKLKKLDHAGRLAVAKALLTPLEGGAAVRPNKIVYRHLRDGDHVLMNRQPTLHKPSMQAHKVRVISNKKDHVLRMPYAVCKAYNADFDGDEMNLHFPQNEIARREATDLMSTHHNYLTPKDGSPLAGLVQDIVVAAVKLSHRTTFLSKEDYQGLVSSGLQEHTRPLVLEPPAVLKPSQLWTGKQTFTAIFRNLKPLHLPALNFSAKANIKPDFWSDFAAGYEMSESGVVVQEGRLLAGVMDKKAIGPSKGGLLHACYELYGGAVAMAIMTAVNRMCVRFLQMQSHTIGVKEFDTPKETIHMRQSKLKVLEETAGHEVCEKFDMDEDQFVDHWEAAHLRKDVKMTAQIDSTFTKVLGKDTTSVTRDNEQALHFKGLQNCLALMVESGSKGNKVNINQLTSLFGPTAIDGQRMPIGLSGASLPCFQPYCLNPCAGGFIPKRFISGMDPASFFWLCIVGRDSMQHTAVKTANSGYMQRCLIKHLEGQTVHYDGTVRDADNRVLQFQYGEDGLDVSKAALVSTQDMDVIVDNTTPLASNVLMPSPQIEVEVGKVAKHKKKVKKFLSKSAERKAMRRQRTNGFILFSAEQETIGNEAKIIIEDKGRTRRALRLQKAWWNLDEEERQKYNDLARKDVLTQPMPVRCCFNGHTPTVVTEAMDEFIETYADQYDKRNIAQHAKKDKKEITSLIQQKVLFSQVAPGEAVGAICAQALGEPLTQMTLNTFHFAGRDELNVTLGVPRMEEILRTATDSISTPIMEVPFQQHITKNQANALKKMFKEVPLKEVIEGLNVSVEDVEEHHNVRVKFSLVPSSYYKDEFPITAKDVLAFIEAHFVLLGILKPISSKAKTSTICAVSEDAKVAAKITSALTDEDALEDLKEEKNEDSGDEMEVANADDDAAEMRRNAGKNETDYNDGESESEDEGFPKSEKFENMDVDDASDEEMDTKEDDGATVQLSKKRKRGSSLTADEIEKRVDKVKGHKAGGNGVLDYSFDTVDDEWCEVVLYIGNVMENKDYFSIIRASMEKAFVYRVPGIKRATIEEKDNRFTLRTEGVNIDYLVRWDMLLELNRVNTNDIQLLSKTLGIGATQQSIIREIRAVQKAYNINIDYRHLSLLASYFTQEGVYRACNRGYISANPSTMQRMSYESCTTVLKKVILNGEADAMQSPTARVSVGQLVRAGTNFCDVLLDFDMINKANAK